MHFHKWNVINSEFSAYDPESEPRLAFFIIERFDLAQLAERIEELIQPILDELGFELVDLVYQRESRGWVRGWIATKAASCWAWSNESVQ